MAVFVVNPTRLIIIKKCLFLKVNYANLMLLS